MTLWIFTKPFIAGCHYLFVPHPAEQVVNTALGSGQPLDGAALAAALALLGFATSSRWPLLIVTAVPTSGAAWYLSHVIVGSAKLLFAAPFHATRGRWADVAIGEAAPPKVTARNNVTLRRPIVWIGMAPFFADAGSEIVVAVVVLTVALLGLYRTLVMAGRWNEAAPSL